MIMTELTTGGYLIEIIDNKVKLIVKIPNSKHHYETFETTLNETVKDLDIDKGYPEEILLAKELQHNKTFLIWERYNDIHGTLINGISSWSSNFIPDELKPFINDNKLMINDELNKMDFIININ